jgi:hypothetical protein
MLDESVLGALDAQADHTPPVELRRPEPRMATICADGSLEIFRRIARTEFELPVLSICSELPIDDDDSDDGIKINRTEFPHGGSITEIDIPSSMESFDVGDILAAVRKANDDEHASRTS